MRIAIALPLLVESVRVEDHLYADGGVVDVFPAQPLLDHERLDLVIGVNTILPRGFEGEDISGWTERPLGLHDARAARSATPATSSSRAAACGGSAAS